MMCYLIPITHSTHLLNICNTLVTGVLDNSVATGVEALCGSTNESNASPLQQDQWVTGVLADLEAFDRDFERWNITADTYKPFVSLS